MRFSIDKLVTPALLIVCLLVGANAFLQLRDRFSTPAAAAPPPAAVAYQPGDAMPQLVDYSYAARDATLLLVLRSSCVFCTRSMPFYEKLAGQMRGNNGVTLVGVSTDPEPVLAGYLAQHRVELDELRSIRGNDLVVPGTPTLILVGRDGRVRGTWVGLQNEEGEESILRSLNEIHSTGGS
jgi:hypothetical protein